ncbi:efflux RND transporter periplasmic adaptor subunit [Candidatus Collierbacteria bacterium]|nr:efflux RND transporter periplasmic adaptor subunit [Candidatus Collierbacteria bacterium]
MAEPIALEGKVTASIRELRFSFAGVVESISVETGKIVGAGTIMARLKTSELGKKHQLKLEAYNKIRATFEQLKKKLDDNDDPDKKYLMDRAQADLNSSVLEVELSQLELDSAELKCPFNGLVIDDGGIAARMAISPASFPIKVIDFSTLKVMAEIDQDKMPLIKTENYIEFKPIAIPGKVYKGRVLGFTPTSVEGKSDKFGLWCILEKTESLLSGMKGSLKVFQDR